MPPLRLYHNLEVAEGGLTERIAVVEQGRGGVEAEAAVEEDRGELKDGAGVGGQADRQSIVARAPVDADSSLERGRDVGVGGALDLDAVGGGARVDRDGAVKRRIVDLDHVGAVTGADAGGKGD